jgi:hypothetical protein
VGAIAPAAGSNRASRWEHRSRQNHTIVIAKNCTIIAKKYYASVAKTAEKLYQKNITMLQIRRSYGAKLQNLWC